MEPFHIKENETHLIGVAIGGADDDANAETSAATFPACLACACAIVAPCVVAVGKTGKPIPLAYPSPTTAGSVDGLS